MKKKVLLLTASLLIPVLLSGCSVYDKAKQGAKDTYNFMFDREPKSGPVYKEDTTPLIELNSDAAGSLFYNISQHHELPPNSPIYVRSFTNEQDSNDTSRFGRIMANQVASRLAQHDLLITDGPPKPMPEPVEMKQAPVPEDNATGETTFFGLLNKKKEEVTPRPAMLMGTYYIGDTVIYMNAKIIRLDDDVVVSSTSWTLPINDNTRELLPQLKRPGGTDPAVRDKF